MHHAFTLVLAAVVVWLFLDRTRLQDELATLKKDTETKAERMARYGQGGGPNSEWLNTHIERGAKALQQKPVRH